MDRESSQKLIRCTVEGRGQSESLRYIELDHYKLWSYMMLHKHGIKIKDASLWLWVDHEAFAKKEELYAHFSDIEQVNRIEISLFDQLYGFTHTIRRYVLAADSGLLEKVLLSHLSPEIVSAGNYEITTGAAIVSSAAKA